MTRTTRADLDLLAAFISRALDCEYTIEYAYGQPRLMRAGGSVDVSPWLPTGELAQWMRAYVDGIDAERRRAAR